MDTNMMMTTAATATQSSTTNLDNTIGNRLKRMNMSVDDGEEEVEENNNSSPQPKQELPSSKSSQTMQTQASLPAKKRRKKVGVSVPMMNGGTMNWWKFGSMQKDYIQDLAKKNPGLIASNTTNTVAPQVVASASGDKIVTSINNDDDATGASNSLRVVSNDDLSVTRGGYSSQGATGSSGGGGLNSIIQALQSKVAGEGGNITIPPHLLQQATPGHRHHHQQAAGPSSLLQNSSSSSSLRNATFPPVDAMDLNNQTVPRRIANAFFRPEQTYTDAYHQQNQVEGGMGMGDMMGAGMGMGVGTARVGNDHNQFVGYDGEEEDDHDDCSEDSNALKFRAYQAENWTERFEEIIEFRNLFGHCLVPNAFPENPALAQWVKRQRYQYKLKMEGKRSTMSDERVTALEDIGFVWDSHSAVWSERLQDLIDYKRVHGHCNVPSRYSENKQLAIWVKRQRRQFKFYCEKQPSAMTEERIHRLNAIGFEWDLKVKK